MMSPFDQWSWCRPDRDLTERFRVPARFGFLDPVNGTDEPSVLETSGDNTSAKQQTVWSEYTLAFRNRNTTIINCSITEDEFTTFHHQAWQFEPSCGSQL